MWGAARPAPGPGARPVEHDPPRVELLAEELLRRDSLSWQAVRKLLNDSILTASLADYEGESLTKVQVRALSISDVEVQLELVPRSWKPLTDNGFRL